MKFSKILTLSFLIEINASFRFGTNKSFKRPLSFKRKLNKNKDNDFISRIKAANIESISVTGFFSKFENSSFDNPIISDEIIDSMIKMVAEGIDKPISIELFKEGDEKLFDDYDLKKYYSALTDRAFSLLYKQVEKDTISFFEKAKTYLSQKVDFITPTTVKIIDQFMNIDVFKKQIIDVLNAFSVELLKKKHIISDSTLKEIIDFAMLNVFFDLRKKLVLFMILIHTEGEIDVLIRDSDREGNKPLHYCKCFYTKDSFIGADNMQSLITRLRLKNPSIKGKAFYCKKHSIKNWKEIDLIDLDVVDSEKNVNTEYKKNIISFHFHTILNGITLNSDEWETILKNFITKHAPFIKMVSTFINKDEEVRKPNIEYHSDFIGNNFYDETHSFVMLRSEVNSLLEKINSYKKSQKWHIVVFNDNFVINTFKHLVKTNVINHKTYKNNTNLSLYNGYCYNELLDHLLEGLKDSQKNIIFLYSLSEEISEADIEQMKTIYINSFSDESSNVDKPSNQDDTINLEINDMLTHLTKNTLAERRTFLNLKFMNFLSNQFLYKIMEKKEEENLFIGKSNK